MSEFDYEMAWAEIARPQFEALSQKVRDLLDYVAEHTGGCTQGPSCDLHWPEEATKAQHIKDVMVELAETDELSHSAHVIHYYGHWFPAGKFFKGHQMTLGAVDPRAVLFQGEPVRLPGGASWHYANYADQVLRKLHGLSRDFDGRGYGLIIHDGLLRACYNSKDCWTWQKVAPVTGDTVKVLRAAVAKLNEDRDVIPSCEPYEKNIEALRSEFAPDNGKWGPLFNLKKYGGNH